MKKIMLAAIVALSMAGMAQASAYYWGVTSDGSLNSYAGDTVYVLLASDWSDSITQAQVESKSLSSATMTKKLNKTGISDDTGFTYGSTDIDGDTLDVVFVDVNASGEYFKWANTLTSTATTSSTKLKNTLPAADFASHAAGGYTSFAPEPTSGLLLLLGVAGLALKRKRA